MWSVVIESPSSASTRAPAMSASGAGCAACLEERRLLHVGGLAVPGVEARAAARRRPPVRRHRSNTSAYSAGTSRRHARARRRGHLVARSARRRAGRRAGPSGPCPSGSVVRSTSTRPGERVGHDERRRGEVVGLHLGVDAPLEVAVAGEHRGDHQVALADAPGDGPRAAARCCRCRSCSRSRRCGSRAPRAAR